MVWTAPMTAVAGNIFKASEFNTHVRDNLMETALGLGETASPTFFVTTGSNSLSGSTPQTVTVATSETTAVTSYTNLTTVGPVISNLQVNSKALISIGCRVTNTTAGAQSRMSVEWSNDGGTTSATDERSVLNTGAILNKFGSTFLVDIVPGSYTFTAKYRVSAGTGTFQDRTMLVFPF